MKRILAFVLATFIPFTGAMAQTRQAADTEVIRPAGSSDLSEFLWTNRPIVVFANTPADPLFSEQMGLLRDGMDMLLDRDVVILTDTDPAAKSALRKKLRPRGFVMVLVDKDGRVALRKPQPWSVREISASIDKTAMRQQEVRERRKRK
jgi:Domain of unknown function (DUF4174)